MKTSVTMFGSVFELSFQVLAYGNGRIAIQAIDFNEGDPFGMVTLNIPEVELEQDEVIAKTYSENAHWVPQVLENLKQHFEPTGKTIDYGNVLLPIYKFVSEETIAGIKKRLEHIRGEIKAERVSYGELLELQSLAKYIEAGDMELQEAAGIPEEEARK
jgi:hypothetical protein